MQNINITVNTPRDIWNELSGHFEVSQENVFDFTLPPKFGKAQFSFIKIGTDIKYLQIEGSFLESINLNFNFTEESKDYKILAFFHGEEGSLLPQMRFWKEHKEARISKAKRETKPMNSLSMISNLKDMPNFTISQYKKFTLNVIFVHQIWLDEIFPDNSNLDFAKPFFLEPRHLLFKRSDKVINLNDIFEVFKRLHDNAQKNKLEIIGELYSILGNYFYLIEKLQDFNEDHSEVYTDQDLRKMYQLERFLKNAVFDDNPSLIDLSKQVGLSKTKMCSLFKEFYGEGIMTYYNNLKIEKAKELLQNENISISEISDRLSIENKSYFTRWFKSHTGQLPTHFRKVS